MHSQKCDVCAEGKAQSKKGSISEHCPDCEIGYYANKQGLTTCVPCGMTEYNDLKGQSGCLSCFVYEIGYGLDRPKQCVATFVLLFGTIGLIVCFCSCCCWAKMGYPGQKCCCFCFYRKKKKFQIPKRVNRVNSNVSAPCDFEFAKGSHANQISIDNNRYAGNLVKVPRQISLQMVEDPIQWSNVNPMQRRSDLEGA